MPQNINSMGRYAPQEMPPSQSVFAPREVPATAGDDIVRLANDRPALLRQVHRYYREGALQRIHSVTDRMRQQEAPLTAAVVQADFPPAIATELTAIIRRLGQRGPETFGGPRNKDAVYLRQYGSNDSIRYGPNAVALERDRQTLLTVLAATTDPMQRRILDVLAAQLRDYGWSIDPQAMSMHEFNTVRSRSPMNRATYSGLRFATVVTTGGLAILNGIIAARAGVPSVAPFLYGGMALYAADPSILSGKARRVAGEANTAIHALQHRGIAAGQNMRGPEWAAFLERTMGNRLPSSTVRLLNERQTPEMQEQVFAALGVPRTNARVRAGLSTLLAQNALAPLLTTLRSVRSPDAQALVAQYVREGAWRYANIRS